MGQSFTIHGKNCTFHEKSNKWVIIRTNLSFTGGSWCEDERFDTKEELIKHLNLKYTKLGQVLKEA